MKEFYSVGQRIAFIARNKCTFNGNIIRGKWSHYVGYIKQVRRSVFGVRYVVNVSKSSDIYFVPQRDVIGVAEKVNQIKTNNNGKV